MRLASTGQNSFVPDGQPAAGYGLTDVPVPRRPRMKVCAERAASARLKVDSRSRSLRDCAVCVSTVDATAMPTLSMMDISRMAVTRTFPRSSASFSLMGR
jgi:hypothetical protein